MKNTVYLIKSFKICKYLISAIIIVVFFYYKPLYLTLVLILFSSEYFYFLNYLWLIKKHKKKGIYKCFEPEEAFEDASIYERWVSINKLKAFKKIYILCLKKKINISSITSTSFIIILGIPLKMINLMLFMLKRDDLVSSLNELYYIDLNLIKDHKIEVFNHKVYVNCSTRNDVLVKIIKKFPLKSKEEIASIYVKLCEVSQSTTNKINKLAENPKKFVLGTLETEEGLKIKKNHWSSESTEKLHGDSVRCLIHATSNHPELSDSQIWGIPMKNLVKPGSSKPGSIITQGRFKFERTSNANIKYIAKWEVEQVYYKLYSEDYRGVYNTLFAEEASKISELIDTEFFNYISTGNYRTVLENERNTTIKEIEEVLGILNIIKKT